MIALRIDSCSDSMLWYNDLVGKIVPLHRYLPDDENAYCSIEPSGYTNIVFKKDASVIEVSETYAFY